MLLLITFYLSVAYYGAHWVSRSLRDYSRCHEESTHNFQESMQNRPIISCFNRSDDEISRFSRALGSYLNTQLRCHDRFYLITNTLRILLEVALGAVVSTLARGIIRGTASPATFIVLVTYWNSISGNLTGLTESLKRLRAILISAEKLLRILYTQLTVIDGSKQLRTHSGHILFEDVSFSYKGQAGEDLASRVRNITFKVPDGSTVALVGESGSGKSTLANLLSRGDDVDKGAIKIDDQDIKDVTLSSLRDVVGIVHQDHFIFDRSIIDNVRFGRPDATDDEVKEVCKAIGLHDMIMKFEEKYEKRVGERVNGLSGGQK
ncbi:uncharacterized protein A1O5_12656 [Cladophialophora psammophila CBS 110553]|uniref:ABC transmembrane type-1 domain-containing protein n=1 Tax=Cladophialophora psammophila CBS 110553 TaxID=1182543 RepID=W9VT37_9EURO|nr:uncharacterized protein A1O5_12656 [Cladophialophora psammophila CBS 110553]EXJ56200.1 hypothetical protein A1O5_12656 [Cladophialophora psammophila CBS 110553]